MKVIGMEFQEAVRIGAKTVRSFSSSEKHIQAAYVAAESKFVIKDSTHKTETWIYPPNIRYALIQQEEAPVEQKQASAPGIPRAKP